MEDAEKQELLDTIARQAKEIETLRQTIDALCRRIFGAKSETLDPAQLLLLLGEDAGKKPEAASASGEGVPAAEIPSHQKVRRKTPRPPRIPERLPLTEETLDPPEVLAEPEAWRRIGEEVREQLDYKRGHFRRIRLVRGKYVRKDDPLAIPQIAPLPANLQDRCTATPGLIAEVITNRYLLHLPYYRQAETFTRQGVPLHRKTLCDWARLGSDWLAAIHRVICYDHRQSTYRQIDETPISYLEPGHRKARKGYLWTSTVPGRSVIYHWQAGRDQSGITEIFGHPPVRSVGETANCVIQCDGFSAYPSWAGDKPWLTLMGCHAHVRRKFFEAKDQSPKLTGWLLCQLGHLYRIEKELRENKAAPVIREATRASQSAPIHRMLKAVLEKLAARKGAAAILPKSLLGKAITYALNQWPHLETYLRDGRVEIDNNLCENAIRPTKLGAKNWLFIGREASGEKTAILYTIIENCRRERIDPREYLEDVLTRLPDMMANEVATLTPANWAKERKPVRPKAA
ncbi:MAG: hypothetical protein RLZZ505_1252 [Verrucomicrobiota bacterium]|jgi:transposase